LSLFTTWARAAAALVGLTYVFLGVWALLAPGSFYDSIATFPPDNAHFLRDVGAFQIGIGLTALACAADPTGKRWVMASVAAATALHVMTHVVDVDAGGSPVRDLASLVLMTVVAAVAAMGMPAAPQELRAGERTS
jgi:hypothetical protein